MTVGVRLPRQLPVTSILASAARASDTIRMGPELPIGSRPFDAPGDLKEKGRCEGLKG